MLEVLYGSLLEVLASFKEGPEERKPINISLESYVHERCDLYDCEGRLGMMYIKRMLSILLVATFAFSIHAAKGESTMNHDEQIISVIYELGCPVLISGISDQVYGSYSIIEAAGLDFIQSWNLDGRTIELYKGKTSDYLAILRNDDRIYCAQYINGFDAEVQNQTNTIPSNAYYHTIETSASGIYVRTEIGFFIDCQSIHRIFWSPTDSEPSYFSVSDSECILAVPLTKK